MADDGYTFFFFLLPVLSSAEDANVLYTLNAIYYYMQVNGSIKSGDYKMNES